MSHPRNKRASWPAKSGPVGTTIAKAAVGETSRPRKRSRPDSDPVAQVPASTGTVVSVQQKVLAIQQLISTHPEEFGVPRVF
jgi:hypothetical protein